MKTKEVLQIIGISTLAVSALAAPSLAKSLITTYKYFKRSNQKDLGRIIKRLQKQEMITLREHDGQIAIEITDKGKNRLLEYDFENIELKAKKRDGRWRLVIFDIPEFHKHARDVFVRKLVQLGLVRLQDSIYVSAFPCKEEVDFLCNYLQISNFVTLVSINNFERGEQLIFQKWTFGDNGSL